MASEVLIIVVGILAAMLGAVIAYLLLRSSRVSRAEYDGVRDQLSARQNALDTQLALERELRGSIDQLSGQLRAEQETNRMQERNIAQLRAQQDSAERRIAEEKELNLMQQRSIESSNGKIMHLQSELSKVEGLKGALEEKINAQTKEFEEARKKSLVEFENIANRLFEEKTSRFSKQSKENIEQLLNPLKENLSAFKKRVEETYDKESKQRFSLESKIKELVDLNQQISKDATNLTNALKGQAKTQGDWGEMILESILEYSGLVRDRQYFVQESYRDEDGRLKQPDVMIKYPDDRYVIVDSKVSLTAYERYANCDDPDEQRIHLASHVRSVRSHIDNLSSKEYERFDRALDFVFLFIPIEPAFLTVLQADSELWSYAYKKRIVIMSPTNLIATLRVISDVWSKEIQNTNAREISRRGEKLYEKFVGFIEDMEDIDRHLTKASDKYNDAMKKLSTGKGNLVSQAQNLHKLGVQSKKQLPPKYQLDGNDDDA